MTQLLESLALAWCRAFHARGFPISGYSRCMVCLCRVPVPWNAEPERAVRAAVAVEVAR